MTIKATRAIVVASEGVNCPGIGSLLPQPRWIVHGCTANAISSLHLTGERALISKLSRKMGK